MLTDYETLVADLVRDDAARLSLAEKDRAIALAVVRYSKDRPRIAVEDITPTDANNLPLPASWEADFSVLRSLEYPKGNTPPTLLPNDRWQLYQGTASTVIRVLDGVAVAASNVRASYTRVHSVTALVDTIVVNDREPVACWAAAILCEQLAAFYSGGTDSTIQADSVRTQTKSQEYAARSKSLRKRYLDEIGVNEERNASAGVVVNLNRQDSLGQDRLTHTARYR